MNSVSFKEAYKQKLKNPNWQRKRLEILGRDNWKCLACCNDESELHVHHMYYEYGKDIWDYPDFALVTLCDDCHYNASQYKDAFKHFKVFMAKQQLGGSNVYKLMLILLTAKNELKINGNNLNMHDIILLLANLVASEKLIEVFNWNEDCKAKNEFDKNMKAFYEAVSGFKDDCTEYKQNNFV